MKWLLIAVLFFSSFAVVCATDFYAGKASPEPYFAVSYSHSELVSEQAAKIGNKKKQVSVTYFNSLNIAQEITLAPKEGELLVGGGGESAPRVELVLKNEFKDITSDCFFNVEATGDNKIQLEYNPFCLYCGHQAQLKVGVSKGTTEDRFIQIIDLPCKADVLLVTDTRAFDTSETVCVTDDVVSGQAGCKALPANKKLEFGYSRAGDAYAASLAKAGLSFRYIDFDKGSANKVSFGNYATPNGVTDWNAETNDTSRRYVLPIRKFVNKVGPKNLIIIGGVYVIPMPFDNDVELQIPMCIPTEQGDVCRHYLASRDGRLPSDDDYVSDADTGLPRAIVSRFPSIHDSASHEDMSAAYIGLYRAAALRSGALSVTVNQPVVEVSDSCGEQGETSECLLRKAGDSVSKQLFGKPCGSAAGKCFLSPSFCIGKVKENIGESCMSHPDLRDALRAYSLIFLAHGDGANFVSESGLQTYVTFSTNPVTEVIDGGGWLGQVRFVASNSCYNGAIDRNAGGLPTPVFYSIEKYQNSIALAFMRAGALAYIGRTRISFYEDDFFFSLLKKFSTQGERLGVLVKQVKFAGYKTKAAENGLNDKIQSIESELATLRYDLSLIEGDLECLNNIPAGGMASQCVPSASADDAPFSLVVDLQILAAQKREQITSREEEASGLRADLAETTGEKAERKFSNVRTLVLYGDPFVKFCLEPGQQGTDLSCLS